MERKSLLGVFAHPDDELGMAGAYRLYHDDGALTALIALSFAFSPVAHGDRYLAAAAETAPAGQAAPAET